MGKQWQGDENLRRNMMTCGKNSIKTIANWWNSGDRGKDDKDKEDVLQEEVEVEEKPGVEGEAKQEDVRLKEEEEEEVKGEPMRLALRTLGVSWNRPLSTGTVAKIGQTNHF